MRVFKSKWIHRWAQKEDLSDGAFWQAAKEVREGNVEADLGRSLCKKRIARRGKGKSGGYRTILAYKKPDDERILFIYAFSKNEKSNINDKEKEALGQAAESYLAATDALINKLKLKKILFEIEEDNANE